MAQEPQENVLKVNGDNIEPKPALTLLRCDP